MPTLHRAACCLLLALASPALFADTLPAQAQQIREALRGNDLDRAVEIAEAASEDSKDARVLVWAGRAYGRQAVQASVFTQAKWAGRTRDAWERAVEIDPDMLDARFDLIQYYLQAPGFLGGGRDKAESQVAAIGQRDAGLGKLAASILAFSDKDAARGEALQREAAELSPDNGRVLLAYSGTLQRGEKWAESEALWRARLARVPGDAMARYQLARLAAIRDDKIEEGLALIDAFIAAGEVPDELSLPAAHWRRGQLLEKLGRIEEARAAYELGKADPSVKQMAEADLKRLASAKG
ncbi:hypothetical protein [Pseudomarimonas salicorniae]|uniref:Tetratricopeptide repeat-containing protein n=1 Tax=Pseudomarimonas salicorniae TaxID=2933270 RepID=A0ABT0GLJ2_9GAMM|nr:hypothetical protein [Lysobacter sp. CAU 1642]MCK7595381.1 hypothetical protein [Lysobacter sp. CAU 1642]